MDLAFISYIIVYYILQFSESNSILKQDFLSIW